MKNLIFIFAAVLFMAASCNDEQVLSDTSTVNLHFKAVYSGEPLVFQNNAFQYKYPQGNQIAFSDLRFFISEVALVEAEGGDEAELIDIEYVNFSNNTTLDEAQRPITYSLDNIPAGKYKALKFSIGVPADQNNENYSQYGANHPLRKNSGEYWSGWSSFIFMKINGTYDIEGDDLGIGNDAALGHHLGGNQFFKTITLDQPIELMPNEPLDLHIVMDLKQLYLNDLDEYLDLTEEDNRSTHDPSKTDVITFLTGNYDRAFTLE
ncbi:MAG TPA: hypothetical protein ENJ20_03085 [Bacteroidetes bacterium]|nr:hypothetical protein [Bacteroidota bacterium]